MGPHRSQQGGSKVLRSALGAQVRHQPMKSETMSPPPIKAPVLKGSSLFRVPPAEPADQRVLKVTWTADKAADG